MQYDVCFGYWIWSKFYEIGIFLVKKVIIGKGPVWALLTLFQALAIKEYLFKKSGTLPVWCGLSEKHLKKAIWENKFFSSSKN